MHATHRNSGVMGMSDRNNDEKQDQPKGIFHFQQIDIPLIVAIVFGVGTVIVSLGYAVPHDDFWPQTFKDMIDVTYTVALILGGLFTLLFAGKTLDLNTIRTQLTIKKEHQAESERFQIRFEMAQAMLYEEVGDRSLLGAIELKKIALASKVEHLEKAIFLLCDYMRRFGQDIQDPSDPDMELPPERLRENSFILTIIFELSREVEREGDASAPINLSGVRIDVRRIEGVEINSSKFHDCNFLNVNFLNCRFTGQIGGGEETSFGRTTEERFHRCRFTKCRFTNGHFRFVDFRYASFRGCTVENFHWFRCDLERVPIRNLLIKNNHDFAIFSFSNLQHTNFAFDWGDRRQIDPEDGRLFFRAEDFSECHTRRGNGAFPDGLSNNHPPLIARDIPGGEADEHWIEISTEIQGEP